MDEKLNLRMTYKLSLILLAFSLIVGCKEEQSYTIATLEEGATYYNNGIAISEILKRVDVNFEVLSDKGLGSYVNCRKLWNDEVDFAIAQNDTRAIDFLEDDMSIAESKIRTVMPLYPEILFVIHSDSIEPASLRDLVNGRRIGVGPPNSGTSIFFRNLLTHFGIDSSEYNFVYTPWSENIVSDRIDVSVSLSGFHSAGFIDMLQNKNCAMFSFGSIDLYKKGSSIEGFCMNYPSAKPYIIPKNAFGKKPETPIMTISIDAVLFCHRDVDSYAIYKIVDEIYKQKNILAAMDPLLGGLTEDFDRNSLGFPLHEGSKMYLERNQPSFFEKYAETFGVILSLLIATSGAFAALIRMRKTRKKNRIDIYYQKLLDIETKYDSDENYNSEIALKNIKRVKEEAVELLIDEKLTANESFNIFLNLSDTLVRKIHQKRL